MDKNAPVTFTGKRWVPGSENPESPEILVLDREERIAFPCTGCLQQLKFRIDMIEPILGALLICDTCGNVSFIPGSLRSRRLVSGETIRGGVLVPVRELRDWYEKHPAFLLQVERDDVGLLGNYGFWLFCAQCKHSFRGSVIQSWMHRHRNPTRFVFDVHDRESKGDLDGLQNGHCPKCGYLEVVGLMVKIPEYVIAAFGPKI